MSVFLVSCFKFIEQVTVRLEAVSVLILDSYGTESLGHEYDMTQLNCILHENLHVFYKYFVFHYLIESIRKKYDGTL